MTKKIIMQGNQAAYIEITDSSPFTESAQKEFMKLSMSRAKRRVIIFDELTESNLNEFMGLYTYGKSKKI